MHIKFKKAMAATAALAVAATAAPFIGSSVASAAATNNGAVTLAPQSGTELESFGFGFSSNPSCPGDSAGGGYNWSSFMIPVNASITSLKFDGNGPIPVGGEYRSALNSANGDPITYQSTNIAPGPGQPGLITGIPQFSLALYEPGEIPAGGYSVGIACHKGPASDPDQLVSYWSTTMAVNNDLSWSLYEEAGPGAPIINAPGIGGSSLGDGQITVDVDPNGGTPGSYEYRITVTGPGAPAAPIVVSGAEGFDPAPQTITGLTNGADYSVTAVSSNIVDDSPVAGPVTFTPSIAFDAPEVTATGGVGTLDVSWTHLGGGSPTAYEVTVTGPAPATDVVATETVSSGTQTSFTGLAAGEYMVIVQPTGYPVGESAPAGMDPGTVLSPNEGQLIQTIQVDRAQVNAIVFEQDCEGEPTTGFATDPCTVDLTDAVLDSTARYYVASGDLHPIRVIDARDTDKGWVVTGNIDETFTDGSKSFDAKALGWAPSVSNVSAPLANGYTMTVEAGDAFLPWSPGSDTLKAGTAVLMESIADGSIQRGLGTATAGATLDLWIPVDAPSGAYSADIVFTIVNKS